MLDPTTGSHVEDCLQDTLGGYFARITSQAETYRVRFAGEQAMPKTVVMTHYTLTASGLDARRGTEAELLPQLHHWCVNALHPPGSKPSTV